jgi:hypothetical protein
MRLLFVHHVIADRGSAQDMHAYAEVGRALGHEVALYGPPRSQAPFHHSLDVSGTDAVIFIFEWTTDLQYGDNLDLLRLAARVPREQRVVIDCDGKYNDAISVLGDYNHPNAETSRRWIEVCDSLTDKIFQPTLRPLRPNVGTFFFHAYNPAWEVPLDFSGKQFGMSYVGNNWFRWRGLKQVLEAVETVQDAVGRILLVGNGWDTPAPWANPSLIEDAYYSDPAYLDALGVEVHPPVRFDEVVSMMGRGVFTPVIYRPLFDELQLVTCRTFESLAANAIPLFMQEPGFVQDTYGEVALDLVAGEKPSEKIADILDRPNYYQELVQNLRTIAAQRYSYEARLQQIMEMLEAPAPAASSQVPA